MRRLTKRVTDRHGVKDEDEIIMRLYRDGGPYDHPDRLAKLRTWKEFQGPLGDVEAALKRDVVPRDSAGNAMRWEI